MTSTHVVADGETLPQIAQQHHVTVGQLMAANSTICSEPGEAPEIIPGQTLIIPDSTFNSQVDTKTGMARCPAMSPNFIGVLLWPAWQFSTQDTPHGYIASTGTLLNHWHYVPGTLNLNVSPPNWTQAEHFEAAAYDYDVMYTGYPLPQVEVDVYAAGGSNLDDYTTLINQVPLCSTFTDGTGRFQFQLEPGNYVLALRSRFSFIQNNCMGGNLPSPSAHRHNGIELASLQNLAGRHRLHLLMTVTPDLITFSIAGSSGQTSFAIERERLLQSSPTPANITASTPYLFYVLPLVVQSNTEQWRACIQALRRAYNVRAEQLEQAIQQTAVLDLEALARWPIDGQSTPSIEADAANELLQRTLLVNGQGPVATRTAAYDHAYWSFPAVDATTKSRGRFIPLGEEHFFSGQPSLYAIAEKTKDTYGRYAVRQITPNLQGRDIRELKIRLILWGSNTNWVDISNDLFDTALREALVRFKTDRQLFRRRILNNQGQVDYAHSSITSIVDEATYRTLDLAAPSLELADVADRDDQLQPGVAQLTEQGYSRLLFYAAEIARRRLSPQADIHVHSSFRTLSHNRRVYLDMPNLHWRLASNAPIAEFTHSGFTTQVGGVLGANNTPHIAGASVTNATVRYREPRGTYVGGPGDYWAADYSRHTTGRALDFCLRYPAHVVEQVQRDADALTLFGAIRAQHGAGRLWLEQRKVGTAAGTTNWIHLDTGDLPMDREEFVLRDDAARGPRWDATLIVRGRVLRQGAGCLGARVRLHLAGQILATAYADAQGHYSLRVRERALTGDYTVRASYNPQYPFQPAPEVPAADINSPAQPVTFTYPGEEAVLRDINLPAPAN